VRGDDWLFARWFVWFGGLCSDSRCRGVLFFSFLGAVYREYCCHCCVVVKFPDEEFHN
jgi:hypothetical protein